MDERTRTEQNGVGITDELREWFENACTYGPFNGEVFPKTATPWFGWKPDLVKMLDRIDERYKQSKRNLTDALHQQEEATFKLSEKSVLLPVDADGVPIRIGDELTNGEDVPAKVRGMVLDESGWMVSTRALPGYGVPPTALRHHHAQTVEDVLRELIHRYDELRLGPSAFDPFELMAEYAAKLRLAGDAE